MAITDGLITRISPSAGDTDLVDIQSGGTLTGTGTKTLVDIAGEKAWNLTSAALNMSFTPRAINPTGATPVEGVTFAVRYRINNIGTGDFTQIFGLKLDSGVGEVRVTKSGNTNLRFQLSSNTVGTSSEVATLSTVHTLVLVYRPNYLSTSSDYMHVWRNQVGRVGDSADYGAGAAFSGGIVTLDRLFIDTPASGDIDILDAIYWDRQLTDAEAAAVADDLRGQLPLGGGADTTPDAFSFTDQTDVALSTLTTSNTLTITGMDAGTAISVSGGEMSINAGAFTSTPTTIDPSDTVQLRVTSSASNSTATNVTLTIGTESDIWTVTTLAAVGTGTVTTGAFKNNTATLQTGLSGLRVVVLDPTDGTTVLNSTGNTTHATTAVLTLSDAALTPATTYGVITLNAAGTTIGAELITAT